MGICGGGGMHKLVRCSQGILGIGNGGSVSGRSGVSGWGNIPGGIISVGVIEELSLGISLWVSLSITLIDLVLNISILCQILGRRVSSLVDNLGGVYQGLVSIGQGCVGISQRLVDKSLWMSVDNWLGLEGFNLLHLNRWILVVVRSVISLLGVDCRLDLLGLTSHSVVNKWGFVDQGMDKRAANKILGVSFSGSSCSKEGELEMKKKSQLRKS